ncbi:MAG: response regulator transcription factor [Candidatus Omnitrophica bacterium]|nr:response regulator transcription factor [Candidatus Omnitrophota bacterium]
MKEFILVVEDEVNIATMLEYNLKKEGYKTSILSNGEDVSRFLIKNTPNLIILDLMLPGIDGLEVCKNLKKDRKTASVPIIILTAKSQETDKIIGLELGADDYITKPFSPRELIARIRAILRRSNNPEKEPETYNTGDLTIDFSKIMITIKGKTINLTSKEFELLKVLINSKGRVLSREHLLDNIWGFENSSEIETRTVDVHIRTLRKKLKTESKRIITVKNYGYRFEEEI